MGKIIRSVFLFSFVVLTGCATSDASMQKSSPFQVASGNLATAKQMVLLVPGALASTRIFQGARNWGTDDSVIIDYRFPGMDGRPFDSEVIIDKAAEDIALYFNQWRKNSSRKLVLIGFSTGAAISIEARGLIENNVETVAISSAVPFPGMIQAASRSSIDILASMARSSSFDVEVFWREYYKTLLFGRDWHTNPNIARRAEQILEQNSESIRTPGGQLGRAHSGDLTYWRLSKKARAATTPLEFYHGEVDPVVPIRKISKLASKLNASVTKVDQVGHLVLTVRPEVLEQIRQKYVLQ